LINSLRAALIALLTLALVPVSFAADAEEATVQESAAVEPASQNSSQDRQLKQSEADKPEVPLEEAAEGVDASVVSEEAVPAATQLPFDIKAAADIAVAAFGGEVLKAEQVEDEMGIHFHIRVVNDGRVRDVVIDAANGEIIKPIETAAVTNADDSADFSAADTADVDAVTGPAETVMAPESEPLADAPVSPAKQEAAKEAVE
jgi:uncharacterized membrane protein YkoI